MSNSYMKVLAVVAGAAIASGCTTLASESTSTASGADTATAANLEASRMRVNELESALERKNRELADIEARNATMDASNGMMTADASLFPPNPKAGECYARVLIPATYKTTSEQVQTRDAAERIEIIPARYEAIQETVVVKEASTALEVVPAVYGDVEERVLVKPASTKIVEVPAVYETITEKVVDQPAHTAWKKGPATSQVSNVLSQSTTDTGEIMCLIEVPATYKSVTKRVLVSPAGTQTIQIPAEYETLTRTVVKQPATTREVVIPAQHDTVTVTRLVSAAEEKRYAIPAEYETITRNDKVSDDSMEWRSVMCEVNMTRGNVVTLQKALADEGYYRAAQDGIIGSQTLSAARKYAIDHNLPAGSSYIPMQVLESLNISL